MKKTFLILGFALFSFGANAACTTTLARCASTQKCSGAYCTITWKYVAGGCTSCLGCCTAMEQLNGCPCPTEYDGKLCTMI